MRMARARTPRRPPGEVCESDSPRPSDRRLRPTSRRFPVGVLHVPPLTAHSPLIPDLHHRDDSMCLPQDGESAFRRSTLYPQDTPPIDIPQKGAKNHLVHLQIILIRIPFRKSRPAQLRRSPAHPRSPALPESPKAAERRRLARMKRRPSLCRGQVQSTRNRHGVHPEPQAHLPQRSPLGALGTATLIGGLAMVQATQATDLETTAQISKARNLPGLKVEATRSPDYRVDDAVLAQVHPAAAGYAADDQRDLQAS